MLGDHLVPGPQASHTAGLKVWNSTWPLLCCCVEMFVYNPTSEPGWVMPYTAILGTRLKLDTFISLAVLRMSGARYSLATY